LRFAHDPPYPEATLINRIDAYTSGVILVAKDSESLRTVQAQFQDGSVCKEYIAIVYGVPTPPQGVIDMPIGAVPDARPPRFWVRDVVKPRESVTHYSVTNTLHDDRAMLRLTPKTGRTHQLRVHLAAIGHPIVGDWLYANGAAPPHPDSDRSPHLLHSALTEFLHPQTQKRCIIEAPLPADMIDGMDG
jgi:RluA family pseudouridine synthase